MEREWLRERLEAGASYEAIGREVGRHASTVARWARAHGLESQHAPRHVNRGGIEPGVLRDAVGRGLSIRRIAAELDVSPATVRHWLRRHGLETAPTLRQRATADALRSGATAVDRTCARHGLTRFILRADGFRCAKCASERVSARRRRIKAQLVAEAGGACALCGYDRCAGVLQFHHIDPTSKRFAVSGQAAATSLHRAREEARKCVLLCANCHAEVENGVADLSPIIGSGALYAASSVPG
jgi:transposase-like protein